jgi:hypothetical protein
LAPRREKASAMIRDGSIEPFVTAHAIRCVRNWVLPVPGPPTMI